MYRSDKEDTTYLGDYFNYNDASVPEGGSYSISLLASKIPIDKEQILKDIKIQVFKSSGMISEEHRKIKAELKRHSGSDLNSYDPEFDRLI